MGIRRHQLALGMYACALGTTVRAATELEVGRMIMQARKKDQ